MCGIVEEPQRFRRRDQRGQLPEAPGYRDGPFVGGISNGHVDRHHRHQRDDRGGPEQRRHSERDGDRRQNGEEAVPWLPLEGVRRAEPPDVVALRILQPGKSQLRALAGGGVVAAHPFDQRLEFIEVIADRRRAQPVIQGMLPERARRPIDGHEHVVQIEVGPGASVERLRAERGAPLGMGGRNRLEPALARDGLRPGPPDLEQPASVTEPHISVVHCSRAGLGTRGSGLGKPGPDSPSPESRLPAVARSAKAGAPN